MSSPPINNATASPAASPAANDQEVLVYFAYYPASAEHSTPAQTGQPDASKLTATLRSATGGQDKKWEAAQWLKDELAASGWSSPAVVKLNKIRSQFIRRNSGANQVFRDSWSAAELSILRAEVIQEVRGHRTAARILKQKAESLKSAMTRVAVNFNRRVGLLDLAEGQPPFQVRTQVALEAKCRRTPALLKILRKK